MTYLSITPKILVFHPGALGDGLLSLPSLRKLRRRHPKHKMIWIGHQGVGKIFLKAGEVEEAYSFESFPVGDWLEQKLSNSQSATLSSSPLDMVVGWMKDDDGYWKTWVERLGYRRSIFRSPHDPQLLSKHMQERYWEVMETDREGLENFFIEEDFQILKGFFTKPDMPVCHTLSHSSQNRFLILLHPGGGSPRKCVCTDTLARLGKQLIERIPGKLAIIGGPADSRYLDPLFTALADLHPLCFQQLDLSTVCGLFNQVKLFLGHDSGLSHLAANCGVPSLVLFGPTDPAVWAPRGRHIRIQRNQDLNFCPHDLCQTAEQLLTEWPLVASRTLKEFPVMV